VDLAPNDLARIRTVAQRLGMSREEKTNALTIEFSTGKPVTSRDEETGHRFWRERDGKIETQLIVERNSFRIDSFSYTRWVGFRAELEALVEVLLACFASLPMERIVLEYTDVFRSLQGRADTSLIIDRDSEFFPSRTNPQEHWHLHSGWFETHDSSRYLVNVDASSAEGVDTDGARHIVAIRTHQALLLEGQSVKDASDTLNVLDRLHVWLKDRLITILTPDARSMIALGEH
jgi:uncharacterized protein (TIGR04255 family)